MGLWRCFGLTYRGTDSRELPPTQYSRSLGRSWRTNVLSGSMFDWCYELGRNCFLALFVPQGLKDLEDTRPIILW